MSLDNDRGPKADRSRGAKLFRAAVLLAVVAVVLLTAITVFSVFVPPGERSNVTDWASTPLISSVIFLAVGFLLFDRWRNVEEDVARLREDQFEAVERIRSSAQDLVKGDVDRSTLRADGLEARVASLEDDHPWIKDLSEHEFIADAWSVRVVVLTLQYLVSTDRIPLAFEYVWHVLHSESSRRLVGPAGDFDELANYCFEVLGDAYLGRAVLAAGISRMGLHGDLGPRYLYLSAFGATDETAAAVASWVDREFARRYSWHRLRSMISGRQPVGGVRRFETLQALWIQSAGAGNQRRKRRAEVACVRAAQTDQQNAAVTRTAGLLADIEAGTIVSSPLLWSLRPRPVAGRVPDGSGVNHPNTAGPPDPPPEGEGQPELHKPDDVETASSNVQTDTASVIDIEEAERFAKGVAQAERLPNPAVGADEPSRWTNKPPDLGDGLDKDMRRRQ